MPLAGKFPEILACVHIPIPFEVRAPEVLRQRFKLAHIVRVGGKEHLVIPHAGGDKRIILRPFPALKLPVDEQALYPCVPDVARVAGIIHARAEPRLHGAVAGGEKAHLFLRKMRGLLHADHVVFLPLILVHIVHAVAVPEAQAGAVREAEHALRGVVFRHPCQLPKERHNMVFPQLRQRAPQQKGVEFRRRKGEQHQLAAHGPAFSAAARPAIGRVPRARAEELRLPRVRRPA